MRWELDFNWAALQESMSPFKLTSSICSISARDRSVSLLARSSPAQWMRPSRDPILANTCSMDAGSSKSSLSDVERERDRNSS